MRLMVIAVPTPAPAMHDIFMRTPRDPLHREDRGEDDKDDGPDWHGWGLATINALHIPQRPSTKSKVLLL